MTRIIYFTIHLTFLFLLSNVSSAQSIVGKILDATTSDPLIGATVKVSGIAAGAITDIDGNFVIEDLQPGKYGLEISYIGYLSKTIKDIVVVSGEATRVDISLSVEGVVTEEISIEADPTLANEESLLIEQKNSDVIQDGISEQQIKRAPDANASDVVKRVTGVNIVGNKFVFVRGISDRYNNTTLNSVSVPSTETDKKSFTFDIFPSKLLENIIIIKSFTPDLQGNTSGGLVQLTTKDFVDQFTYSFEVSGTVLNTTTLKGGFYDYDAGQSKLLFWNSGYDDGGREIPSNFPSTPFSGFNNYGKTLKNNWQQNDNKAPLNGGFQLSLGNSFNVGGNPLGILGSYTYRNQFANTEIYRNIYNYDTTTLLDLDGRSSVYSVLSGALLNLNYKVGNNNKFSIKNTYSLLSDDFTQYFEGIDLIESNNEKRLYGYYFNERSLFTTQFSGSHYIGTRSAINVSWNASYSEASRNEPDYKTLSYQRVQGDKTPFFVPITIVPNARVGERFFSELTDLGRFANLDYEMKFMNFGKKFKSKFKAGILATDTRREFDARLFAPIKTFTSPFDILFQPPDSVLGPWNIDSTIISYVETTNKSDSYDANENTYSGYGMFDGYFSNFRFVLGLRFEYNEQKLQSFQRTTQEPINVYQINRDYLPSFGLTYELNPHTNIRATYSMTVSRPELRELAPFGFIDFITQGETSGNPDLEESLIRNYDLRYELFPDAGEILSASLFYKKFDQPIERVVVPVQSGDFRPSYTYENAKNGAVNYGIEIEVRKKLGFISKYLDDLSFNGNVTFVNSEVDLEGLQIGSTDSKRRMEGQSPYLLNLGLFYDNYDLGLSLNMLYNRFGERIVEVGKIPFNDVREQGRNVIDFSATKSFLTNFEAKFTVKDILAEDQIFLQEFDLEGQSYDKEVLRNTFGTNYTLTLSYKF
ncbi:MAG: TonB-dependent receptor [Ignavibacteria bacterium]|nr:TonB-dependent receptor [Ignavibacteria bacterium]